MYSLALIQSRFTSVDEFRIAFLSAASALGMRERKIS